MSAVLEKQTEAPKLETRAPKETAESVAELQKLSDTLKTFQKKHGKAPDCSTDEGYEQAKVRRNAARAVLKSADESHQIAKAFYLRNGRTVDAMKNDVIAVAEPIRKANHEAMKIVDNAKKEAEAEAARVEQERQDAIDQAIADIKALDSVVDLDSVLKNIQAIDDMDLQAFSAMGATDDQMAEYESAGESVLVTLTTKKTELERQATEAAALAAEREQLRKEQEAAAEKQRAADAELQRQRDELEAEKKAIADEKEKAERAAVVAEQQRVAQERADREKKEAAEKAESDKKAAVEAERIATEQRIERERQEAEAKAEAERLEAEKQAALAPIAEQLRAWFESIHDMPAVDIDPKDGDTLVAYNSLVDAMYSMDSATAQLVERTKAKAA